MSNKPMVAMAALGAAALALIAVAVYFGIRSDNEYASWCQSQGGHVTTDTHVVSVVGANGKPGIGTTSTSFCLSADGRILDVR